jgi:hypothetical protein
VGWPTSDRTESARQALLRSCLQIPCKFPCKFPVTGNLTGNFALFTLFGRQNGRISAVISASYGEIPYAREQGIFSTRTGNFSPEQGINREFAKAPRQVRHGAKSYRRRSGQFDRNPLQIHAPSPLPAEVQSLAIYAFLTLITWNYFDV